jgi:hypothetical protein
MSLRDQRRERSLVPFSSRGMIEKLEKSFRCNSNTKYMKEWNIKGRQTVFL